MHSTGTRARLLPITLALATLVLAAPAGAERGSRGWVEDWTDGRVIVHGYLDYLNLVRSKNFQGSWHHAGNRLTLNLEIDADLLGPEPGFLDEASFFTILRPRYDFVYETESNNFGNSAGPGGVNDLFRSGFGDNKMVRARFPNTKFPLEVPYRPNQGPQGTNRCLNCNRSESELAWGDTDSFREYPLREAYFDVKKGDLAIRLGKQQVVWGKTDFFRLQDVINPVDFGVHSFLDGLEDIRIPQWMLTGIYNFHDVGPLKDVSLELVWNWDKFLPLGLGQGGEPWANIFGEEIRAFARFHDLFGFGVDKQNLPAWNVRNTQFGGRLEFLTGPVRIAVSDYYRWQDLPHFTIVNRFCDPANPGPLDPPGCAPNPLLIGSGLEFCCAEIDLNYGRVNILGLSLDYFEEFTQTVWRIESTWTNDEDFVNTRKSDWFDESDVIRWSIGVDRITFFRMLNPTRSFFLSWQIFATHILEYEGNGDEGFLPYRNDFTATFFVLTNYMNDRLNPLAFVAYQFNADALAAGAQLEYLITDHWSARVGVNVIGGRKHTFDNRPFEIFAGGDTTTENFFGTVREGFGADRDRDEVFFAVRYRF